MHEAKLRSVDLNLLVVLDVLLEERHVSRAAVRLSMSQPAVSRALSRLRTMFDDPLLVRTASGFELSSRAKQVQQELHELLNRMDRVIEPPEFNPKTDNSVIRVTGLDMELALYLPPLVKFLREEAPNIRIETVRQEMDSFPMLEHDEVHFSLSGLAPLSAEGSLHRVKIEQMPVVCLMAKSNPLADTDLTPESYASAAHGLVSITGRGPGIMDRVLEKYGLSRKVSLRLAGFTSVADFCEDSDLIFTLPQKIAERIAEGRELSLRNLPAPVQQEPVTFYLYWHERYHKDPRIAWIREQFVRLNQRD